MANKAYQMKKKRLLQAVGNAVRDMQKSAITTRIQSNFREVKSSLSAMKTFPRQASVATMPAWPPSEPTSRLS